MKRMAGTAKIGVSQEIGTPTNGWFATKNDQSWMITGGTPGYYETTVTSSDLVMAGAHRNGFCFIAGEYLPTSDSMKFDYQQYYWICIYMYLYMQIW